MSDPTAPRDAADALSSDASALRPVRVDAHVLRWPVREPVRTSFGTMLDRPALLVRVEDADGVHGWGEVWCNFPGCGAEHRARLVQTVLAPLVLGVRFASPRAAFDHLSARTAVLALQTGEPGPIAQAVAGVDLALWDLVARRAARPLWRHLGGGHDAVDVYASGINPDGPERVALHGWGLGHRAFKLKVGFGRERDVANVARLRETLPPGTRLMTDANQAWSLDDALIMAEALASFDLEWLEEPLRADAPLDDWRTLRERAPMPLAAGENVAGAAAFDELLGRGDVAVVQPDVAKWGGLSGVLPVVERIHAAGRRFCPHYLGAGVGLMASAHLLAATGRPGGMLEVDANDNPLRTVLAPALAQPQDGRAWLGNAPGLGVEPDLHGLASLAPLQTFAAA